MLLLPGTYAGSAEQCISWRQTGGCSGDGEREPSHDKSCDTIVPDGMSGYCECADGVSRGAVRCLHAPFTCIDVCAGRKLISFDDEPFVIVTRKGATCASEGLARLENAAMCEVAIRKHNKGDMTHAEVQTVGYDFKPAGCSTACATFNHRFCSYWNTRTSNNKHGADPGEDTALFCRMPARPRVGCRRSRKEDEQCIELKINNASTHFWSGERHDRLTALMVGAGFGDADLVLQLLDGEQTPLAQDVYGNKALDWASLDRVAGWREQVSEMRPRGAGHERCRVLLRAAESVALAISNDPDPAKVANALDKARAAGFSDEHGLVRGGLAVEARLIRREKVAEALRPALLSSDPAKIRDAIGAARVEGLEISLLLEIADTLAALGIGWYELLAAVVAVAAASAVIASENNWHRQHLIGGMVSLAATFAAMGWHRLSAATAPCTAAIWCFLQFYKSQQRSKRLHMLVSTSPGPSASSEAGVHPSIPGSWLMRYAKQRGYAAIPLDRSVDKPIIQAFENMLRVPDPENLGVGHDYACPPCWKAMGGFDQGQSLRVAKVWRIENPTRWIAYEAERVAMKEEITRLEQANVPWRVLPTELDTKLGNVEWDPPLARRELNEAILLHGTKPELIERICANGFSEKYAGGSAGALLGEGVYFADQMGKCDQYATTDLAFKRPNKSPARGGRSNNDDALSDLHRSLYRKTDHPGKVHYVVVCRALMGHYVRTTGRASRNTRAFVSVDDNKSIWDPNAVEKELAQIPGVQPAMSYHSLVAEKGPMLYRYSEFVHFHPRRVYPAYLIAYHRRLPGGTNSPR